MQRITDEQIAQAVADAAAAERKRAETEAAYAKAPARSDLHQAFNEAVLNASHAAARVRAMRAEQEQQAVALQVRRDTEKAIAKGLAATVRKLNASRDATLEAVATAEKAIAQALAAAAEHDQLVRSSAADLRARGLRLDDDGQTGGSADGSLHVDGEIWRPVDGPSLVASIVRGAVAEASPRHPLGRAPMGSYGGVGAARGRDYILGRLRAER